MSTRTIRALFLDGIELALWETAQECAEHMEFDSQKLRRSWMNEAGNADDLEDARRKLIAKIDGLRGATPPPVIPPVRQLYVEGLRQELWTTRMECAEAVDLSADTLRKYMDRQKADCAGTREVTQFTEMQATLRKKLRPQKRSATSDSPPTTDPASPAATPQGTAATEDSLLDVIVARVVERLHGTGVTAGPSQPSDWIDEVFAGHRELIGQSTPECRFVIARASDIVPLMSGFTKGERTDTAALVKILITGIRELRRRLTLSAQTADQAARKEDLNVLGAELDTLVVGIEQASDANLGAAAALRQAQRTELLSLRTTLTGGEKLP